MLAQCSLKFSKLLSASISVTNDWHGTAAQIAAWRSRAISNCLPTSVIVVRLFISLSFLLFFLLSFNFWKPFGAIEILFAATPRKRFMISWLKYSKQELNPCILKNTFGNLTVCYINVEAWILDQWIGYFTCNCLTPWCVIRNYVNTQLFCRPHALRSCIDYCHALIARWLFSTNVIHTLSVIYFLEFMGDAPRQCPHPPTLVTLLGSSLSRLMLAEDFPRRSSQLSVRQSVCKSPRSLTCHVIRSILK